VDAVVLREHYELADYDRDCYIAEKSDLLVYPEPNRFRHDILGNTIREK
jgi:NADH-quinone oxidoreductase subunit I